MRMLSETLHPLKPVGAQLLRRCPGAITIGAGGNGYNSVFLKMRLFCSIEGNADQPDPHALPLYNESPASYNVTELSNMLWGPDKDNASAPVGDATFSPASRQEAFNTCGPNSVTLGNTSS
jgi:hypothetical protein